MIEYENLGRLNASFFKKYEEYFSEFLRSGWYVLGKNVSNFEKLFATYCDTKFCAGVANGLDALVISLQVLNIPKGSEVIVPSNTYIATILAIYHAGLVPVLVEPNIETYNICPSAIAKAITRKTKCIMVVHLYGKCCEMDEIQAVCKAHNLYLVEDCAQAHGASYKDNRAGSWGDVNAFSFYPTKNLGALGDAGAITTNSDELYNQVLKWRNYGSSQKYHNDIIGYNSRLDEVQAGFLSIKLKKLDEINMHKRLLADYYFNHLNDSCILPVVDKNHYDVYHIFNIRHRKRDLLQKYLLQNGIKTEIHYPIAPHNQLAMKDIIKGKFPISEEVHATTLSLPISLIHTIEDVATVCEKINNFE